MNKATEEIPETFPISAQGTCPRAFVWDQRGSQPKLISTFSTKKLYEIMPILKNQEILKEYLYCR